MKSIPNILVAIFAVIIALSSCEEIGPNIDLGDEPVDTTLVDTNYLVGTVEAAQQKKIFIEDFTGVKCKNCPGGHEAVENIKAAHPGRIVSIAIHSDFLADPYPGDQDLRKADADDLVDLLSPFFGKPSGGVDRKIYPGKANILSPKVSDWPGFADQQIPLTTPVNVYVEEEYDEATRDLLITVRLHYTAAVSANNRLSVMVIENDIVASQLKEDDSIDAAYVQEHVLRKIISRFNGDVISPDLEPGREIVKQYRLSPVPDAWNDDHLAVVALVHNFGSDLEVQQVAEVEVEK